MGAMLKQRTVYFREEDIEAWKAIKNKAEWLHTRLHPGGAVIRIPFTAKAKKPSPTAIVSSVAPKTRHKPKGVVGHLYGIEINPDQDITVPTNKHVFPPSVASQL